MLPFWFRIIVKNRNPDPREPQPDFPRLINKSLAQVEVLAGSPDSPTFIESNFLIEEPDLSLFVESTRLIYEITLPPTNTPIAPSTLGVLKLESKSTFYFEF